MSSSPSTTTSPDSPVTAPPGTGLVVIPGGTPGAPAVAHPSTQAAVPGPQSDSSDFWGLGAAVVVIVVAIFVVRRLVPVRHQSFEGRHPAQPPGAPGAPGAPVSTRGAPGPSEPGSPTA